MALFAIPTHERQLCRHFGHCSEFALVRVENNTIEKATYKTPPAHEPGVLPRWLHEIGVTHIISGGMGQRAQMLFQENNIEVCVGASAATPEDLVRLYLDNKLELGDNPCDH